MHYLYELMQLGVSAGIQLEIIHEEQAVYSFGRVSLAALVQVVATPTAVKKLAERVHHNAKE